MPYIISESQPGQAQLLEPILPSNAHNFPLDFELRTALIVQRLRSQQPFVATKSGAPRASRGRSSAATKSGRLTKEEREAIAKLKQLGLWEEP